VTKRLERVPIHCAVPTQDTAVQTSTPSPKKPASAKARIANNSKEDSTSSLIVHSKQIIPSQLTSMSVAGYEDLLAGPVSEYLQLSQKIGGDVAVHSKFVEKVFQSVVSLFYIEIEIER